MVLDGWESSPVTSGFSESSGESLPPDFGFCMVMVMVSIDVMSTVAGYLVSCFRSIGCFEAVEVSS